MNNPEGPVVVTVTKWLPLLPRLIEFRHWYELRRGAG